MMCRWLWCRDGGVQLGVPMIRAGRTVAVSALLVAGLALTGCSGDGGEGNEGGEGNPSESASPTKTVSESGGSSPEPGESGSSSGSSSGSESGSPSVGPYEPATSTSPAKNVPVPEMPDAVKEPTQEGLEAAVEYWWETEYYLKATGESSEIESMSTDDCGICVSLINRWSEVYELGGWAENGPAKVEVQFTSVDNGGTGGTGAMLVSESPGQMYKPDGVPAATGDGSDERPWVFSAIYDKSSMHWSIDDIEAQG
ncbi:DUF6318 family protein [Citricoccus sp. GCM10030269]|uniref:DUF6318 family protein n=1 Tax=Citricoccus sp. GCM10030269 TaxID=3273388 RepID=UPI0036235CE3